MHAPHKRAVSVPQTITMISQTLAPKVIIAMAALRNRKRVRVLRGDSVIVAPQHLLAPCAPFSIIAQEALMTSCHAQLLLGVTALLELRVAKGLCVLQAFGVQVDWALQSNAHLLLVLHVLEVPPLLMAHCVLKGVIALDEMPCQLRALLMQVGFALLVLTLHQAACANLARFARVASPT